MTRRPGFLVYGLLIAFVLGSCAPLYWSFLVGSHSREVLTERVPPLLPGGHFLDNAQRALDTIPFWKALGNSLLVPLSDPAGGVGKRCGGYIPGGGAYLVGGAASAKARSDCCRALTSVPGCRLTSLNHTETFLPISAS